MSVTAGSTPNSAWIKYWGNRNDALRLPMADSFSMTLDSPTVEITLDHADVLSVRSFNPDGSEKELGAVHIQRFGKTLELVKQYLRTLGVEDALPASALITVRSQIPPAVGLASSSAVFSCLARAIQGLILPAIELTDEQTSVLARLGSGSAARSIFGGFSALLAGESDAIGSAYGRQYADEHHWALYNVILVPSMHEKKVGSTEGHPTAHTSPHYAARVQAIRTRRQRECIDAVLTKDFEKLQHVVEEDCIDMHHVMRTSTPPLDYLTEDTHRITRDITELRRSEHLPVFYTMDAGPTVQLLCTEEARDRVLAFARAQEGCALFEAKTGPGACLIP
ncbi:diphosphomevalonate decarboxylase [Candidatus Peribacteria bacterium RIFOXYC2_FULL_55_14]|nr:MAG: mevalonate diphosphate decarboxylase [Candidatus Peribacteria bacterium GW2011_GWC2_54_8]KKW41441.1 MAG: mevalonate diphosphate decarboxylase [Candidatus Peregrinibacteria bacterium GW2011_GWA2_54_9]OGJ72560.1 MAG: diphosphomevalonate decarboxylase [Candidatus Peribacteria bacterium RIFOXYA1_FULL_56_14]OGJ73683.1 MAG: diphosphomevalonate decarboxylase [Candidatus Peribacteria bacterium RIFOXYA2_FULL_55_28]OGJ75292.1 MAG: diphosphomevalonate decarboxylase [Candidatus Peribacteria bacteri